MDFKIISDIQGVAVNTDYQQPDSRPNSKDKESRNE